MSYKRLASALLVATVLCDTLGLATAVDLDVFMLTASDISASAARKLQPKLEAAGYFKGYTSLTAATTGAEEAANLVAEETFVDAVIAAKAASGRTTVLIWRPVTVSKQSSSLATVGKALHNDIEIIFIQNGPYEGSSVVTVNGDPISVSGYSGAGKFFSWEVDRRFRATQVISGTNGEVGLDGFLIDDYLPAEYTSGNQLFLDNTVYGLSAGETLRIDTKTTCVGGPNNGRETNSTAGTCSGGTCTCGTTLGPSDSRLTKTITSLKHLYVVQPEPEGAILKLAQRYCSVQTDLSNYIVVYPNNDGDGYLDTYKIWEASTSLSTAITEQCAHKHTLFMDIYMSSDHATAIRRIRDALIKYTHINGVITMTAEGAVAAVQAIRNAEGRSMSDMTILTLGLDDGVKDLLVTHELAGAVDMGYATEHGSVASATMALIQQVFVDGSVPSDGVIVQTATQLVVPDYASWLTGNRLASGDLKARPIDPTIPISSSRASIVGVALLINYYTLSVKAKEFGVTGWLRLSWDDVRLSYSEEYAQTNTVNCVTFIDKIWQPDIYFTNSRNLEFTDFSCSMSSSGKIFYSRKFHMISACPPSLAHFPFDTTSCEVDIESTYSSERDVVLELMSSKLPAYGAPPIEWNLLGKHKKGSKELHGDEILVNISSGSNYIMNTTEIVASTSYIAYAHAFPKIRFTFNFWRKPTWYFLTLIIPGALLVVLSWTAMWTPEISSRTAISVTTLLANFALRSSAMNMLPASSTVSWLEQVLTVNVVLLFFGTVQTGLAYAGIESLEITKEMRDSWRAAREHAKRAQDDIELVDDEVPQQSTKRNESVFESVKRPCGCCEWWLLYRTGATNWPDVIGQIVWPLTHLVIIVSFCDSGWNEGAAVACEQEIQTLCGTSFSHFISGRLS